MQQPKQEKKTDYTSNVYRALREKVQGFDKSEEQFRSDLQNPEYVEKVHNALSQKVSGFNKPIEEFSSLVSLKKKSATDTTTSLPSTGENSSLESKIYAGNNLLDKNNFTVGIPNKEVKTTVAKLDKSSQYQVGSVAWSQEKLKQNDPNYTSIYDRFKETQKVSDDKKAKIVQEVNEEFEGKGIWNNIKDFGKKAYNTVVDIATASVPTSSKESVRSGIKAETDTFKKEKEQAKKEFSAIAKQAKNKKEPVPSFSDEDIAKRAKEIKIEKRIKSESDSQVRELLKDFENTTLGPGTENFREKLHKFQVMDYSTLKEDEKLNLMKQNVQRDEIDHSIAKISALNSKVREFEKKGTTIPDDFKNEYEAEIERYQSVVSDAINTHKEFVSNQKKLGSAEENLDIFKRDYGWLNNFVKNVDATLGDISSGMAGAIDYGINVKSKILSSPIDKPIQKLAQGVASDLKTDADKARSEVMKPLSVDEINNISDFGSWFSNTVLANQVPIYALVATGAPGIATIGVSSTGQKYEEMLNEMQSGKEYSDSQLIGIPAAFGATETASAMVDRLILNNASRVIRSASTAERKLMADGIWSSISNNIAKPALNVAKGGIYEGLDESGTQIAQNILDKYAGDKKDVQIFDHVKDAGSAGAIMGMMLPFGSHIVSAAIKPFSTDTKIQKASSEILNLEKQLDNPELTGESRKIIEGQLSKSKASVESLLKKQIGNIESLSDEQFQEIIRLEKAQANIKNNVKEIASDENLDEETKKLITQNLKDEFDANDKRRIDLIERGANVQLEKLDEKEVIDLKEKATKELEKELNPDGTREITLDENEISKRAIKIYNESKKANIYNESTSDTNIITDKPNETTPEDNTGVDGNIQPGTGIVDESRSSKPEDNSVESLQKPIDSNRGEEIIEVKAKQYRTSEKGKPYDVKLENGILSITNDKGLPPSPPTRRAIEEQWSNDFNFTEGEIAPIISTEGIDINTHIAENSKNPAEIAETILNLSTENLVENNLSYNDQIIADNIGKIKQQSFERFGDKNNINGTIARNYFNKKGASIDTLAQELSEISGTPITEQDIIDFIIENPKGPTELKNSFKREAQDPLKSAFTELTGLPANEKYLKKAVEQKNFNNNFATALDMLSDEELLSLDSEREQFTNDNYEKETTNSGSEGSSESQNTEEDGRESGIQDSRSEQTADEDQSGTEGIIEQASVQDRNSNLVTERIKPENRPPNNTPKKLNQIIKDVADGLKSTLIYSRSSRRNSLGTYNSTNTLVRITRAGDIDTVAHELGHYLDDKFNLLGTIPNTKELNILRQIKWFSDRGGSNPPSQLSKAKKAEYLEREGLAEFVRAYVVNPTQSKLIAPELHNHFESTVNEETLSVLKKFSDDFLDFANASYSDQITSNIEESNLPQKNKVVEWLKRFKKEEGKFGLTPFDSFTTQMLNSMHFSQKAFSFLVDMKGLSDLIPEKNFEILSRLFAGINGKVNRMLTTGLVDSKNNIRKDSEGNAMTVKWLFEGLDGTTEKTLKEDMDDVIRLLIAERTIEYVQKFGRLNNLTGIGGGVNSDVNVAQGFLNDFNALKSSNEEKFNRITEGARRYREFADAGLKYAVEKGRLSESQYQIIKDNNQFYVSLARIQENSPMEEALAFENPAAGNISSVKDIIKKARGGSNVIQNPYISLLKNTVAIVRESDRNEVIQSFIEPLKNVREMGNGTPIDFAQIARPSKSGDKNTRTVFIDGEKEVWQFQQDIYNSLTSLEAAAKNPIIDFLALPGSLIRFTVTNFPTFALRNASRDTVSRLLVSRTGGKLSDLVHNATDKEVFELYGGSQAGFYLVDKKAYQDTMQKAIEDITSKGGFVLNPMRIAKGYRKLLERGENLNRVAEFKSAFRKAKKLGMDDYNSGLYAAYQARDLMDFAVAGHTMRVINRIVPFSNAGVQGLRRTGKAIKESPGAFALRTALYTVLPTVIFRAIVSKMGDDDEYEELPSHQRDLFWNFKTPVTGDAWIAIPKPFEQGMTSSLVDRVISKSKGSETAFDGFSGSLIKTLMPFDEASMLGGFKPILEASVNYNMFTDRPIVSPWEEEKMMELRKGDSKASRISQTLTKGFDEVGWSVDPRKVDHVIKGYGTYMAEWGLAVGDIGVEKTRFGFGVSKTGFAKDVPMSNAVSVNAVYKLASELDKWRDPRIKGLRNDIEKFMDLKDASERSKLSKEIYAKAKEIRFDFEKEKKEIKAKEKAE